jgi:hypothetical protein
VKVLGGNFGSLTPEGDINERRLINPLTGLILPLVVDCEPNFRDGRATWRVSQFNVSGDVPD